jgi:hypothetical protein
MNYKILTSFNQKYWDEVARDNVKLLDQNWINGDDILLYHQLENPIIDKFSMRVRWFDLYKSCPELIAFIDRWKNEPRANGTYRAKPEHAFKWNAIKFAHKTFAIWHAAKNQKNGWLIWLDCDALLFRNIDEDFIKKIFLENKMVCYLGRKGKYSECGFLAFNLNLPQTRKFLEDWENLYLTGEFLKCDQTHDSFTFDHMRKINDANLFFDLNANSTTDKNPFSNSIINTHLAHAKGGGKVKTSKKLRSKLVKDTL